MIDSGIFLELLILFGAATLVATVCFWLKLPTIVGFIVAGMLVGPSGIGLVSSLPAADSLAEIAGVFLMFTIGLEFSFRKLIELRREFLKLGLLQVLLTVMLTAIVAHGVLGVSMPKGVFFGCLIALSSTALVMKLLQDARDVETPYGKSAVSILLFQDLAVIPMMLALPFLAAGGGVVSAVGASLGDSLAEFWSVRGALLTVGKVVGSLALLYTLSRYVIPLFFEKVVSTRSREVFFFCVLFLLLGVAYLFHLGGLSLGLGAFAAGMMVSESPYGRQVTADVVPMRDNFLGLFFASIGMLLDLNFVFTHLAMVLGLGLAGLAIKAFIGVIVCLFNRSPLSIAAIVALMIAQVGEFSFILASRGLDLGLFTKDEHQYFLSVSVLSMVFTPFLFRLAPKLALNARFGGSAWRAAGASPEGRGLRSTLKKGGVGHAIIIGFGIAGKNMAAAMDALGIHFQAIELNYDMVKKLKAEGVPVHFGDATRGDVLEHAGLGEAKLVVISVSGSKIVPHIIAEVRALRPDVQIIVRAQYLRELESIKRDPALDIVVAEVETSVELLARALKVYGVESDEIRSYMQQARQQLNTFAQMTSALQSPTLNLPSWEALSSIRPMRIGDQYAAVNRTLADLNLRERTGTSVVSIFRDGLGTTVPGGDFVFRPGDVAHLIGSPDGLADAERLLRGEKRS